jgi:immune inhibitor A
MPLKPDGRACSVAPSPRVLLTRAAAARAVTAADVRTPGLDDGMVYPPEMLEELPAAAAVAVTRAARNVAPPATGNKEVLVLLVEFPDVRAATPVAHYERLLFGDGPGVTLRNYYAAASRQQLRIGGKVEGWLTLPQPLAYYVGRANGRGDYPNNSQKLAADALDLAERAGVDLSRFDRDGDGLVDGLLIVHAGTGAEDAPEELQPQLIWSHKWNLRERRVVNGVSAWPYTLQPEDGAAGVFCHEFGHFLGLPDLYDESGTTSGVGNWCLMGYGSWGGDGTAPVNLSAWCQEQLGWTPVIAVKESADLVLPAGEIRRLDPKRNGPDEYFLLETRRRMNLDAELPADGLLIWHVDNTIEGNHGSPPHLVELIQADGQDDLDRGAEFNFGDAGDPYPGSTSNTSWGPNTTPGSRTHDGKPSGLSLDGIAFDGGTATARFTKR